MASLALITTASTSDAGYQAALQSAASASAQALANQQSQNSLYANQIQVAENEILPLLSGAQARLQSLLQGLTGDATPPAPITIPVPPALPAPWPTFSQDFAALIAADTFGLSGQQASFPAAPPQQPYQANCVVYNRTFYALTDYSGGRYFGWVRIFCRNGTQISNPDLSLPNALLPDPNFPPDDENWATFDAQADALGVGGYVNFLKSNATPSESTLNQVVGTLNSALPGWSVVADVLAPILPFAPLLAALAGGLDASATASVAGGISANSGSLGATVSSGTIGGSAGVGSLGSSANLATVPAIELQDDVQNSILSEVQALLGQASPVLNQLQGLQWTLADAVSIATNDGLTLEQQLLDIAGQILSGIGLILELGAAIVSFGAAVPGLALAQATLNEASNVLNVIAQGGSVNLASQLKSGAALLIQIAAMIVPVPGLASALSAINALVSASLTLAENPDSPVDIASLAEDGLSAVASVTNVFVPLASISPVLPAIQSALGPLEQGLNAGLAIGDPSQAALASSSYVSLQAVVIAASTPTTSVQPAPSAATPIPPPPVAAVPQSGGSGWGLALAALGVAAVAGAS